MNVRFFVWDDESKNPDEQDFAETDEAEFLEAEGVIKYERHTVFENGVSQICLTKVPSWIENC